MANMSGSALGSMPARQLQTREAAVSMDPRLQRFVSQRLSGQRIAATSSSEADEIPVIAKVTKLDAWQGLSEVGAGYVLAKADGGTHIVTARVPVSRIEHVRSQPFVTSLKAAQGLHRMLAATVDDVHAKPMTWPDVAKAKGGAGVVVGIIDYGCDFAHKNFRNPAGGTRILSIWDQSGTPLGTSAVPYGREYTQIDIDGALQDPNPYSALGYGPDLDTAFDKGTHGTHVMDIATGNGSGSGVAGVAPDADIIFVHVAASDVPWSGAAVVGSSFGNSVQLLEAIRYVFDRAGDRPCVVNLSLGTNGGPHDGTVPVEKAIDGMVREKSNRAVVIAASNSFADGIHTTGVLAQGKNVELRWLVPSGDLTDNELELWYTGAARVSVELIAPGGNSLGIVTPGNVGEVIEDGETQLFVANRLNDPNNGDNMIGVYMGTKMPKGVWTVRLRPTVAPAKSTFHAWIERDDLGQSQFDIGQQEKKTTIGSISCSEESIVVGSYDAHKQQKPMSYFSSAGPTRDGRPKPELCAPGHAVLAAWSRTLTGVIKKSGTSMAAPAVAGCVALIFAAAKAAGKSLSSAQLRQLLKSTAKPSPAPGGALPEQIGWGKIDVAAAISALGPAVPAAKSGAAKAPRRKKQKKRA